jgi:predicted HTH transcriptional regulator
VVRPNIFYKEDNTSKEVIMRKTKPTSKIAWKTVLEDLSPRQAKVFEVVKENPGITQRECKRKLRRDVNTFSGRFTELEKLGLIKVCGEKYFNDSRQPHCMYKINK